MAEKMKTGLCVLALLLALLAAYMQEAGCRSADGGTLVQPAPFCALVRVDEPLI